MVLILTSAVKPMNKESLKCQCNSLGIRKIW